MDERAHTAGKPHAEQPIPSDFTCFKCGYSCGGLRDKACPECGTEITPLSIAQHLDRSTVIKLLVSAKQRVAFLALSVIALLALAALIGGGWQVAGVLVIVLCALMLVPFGCGWIIALSFRAPVSALRSVDDVARCCDSGDRVGCSVPSGWARSPLCRLWSGPSPCLLVPGFLFLSGSSRCTSVSGSALTHACRLPQPYRCGALLLER